MLTLQEEEKIINIFNKKIAEDELSVVVNYEDISNKNYSLSAGQYFEVKIEYENITPEEFKLRVDDFSKVIEELLKKSNMLSDQIKNRITDFEL